MARTLVVDIAVAVVVTMGGGCCRGRSLHQRCGGVVWFCRLELAFLGLASLFDLLLLLLLALLLLLLLLHRPLKENHVVNTLVRELYLVNLLGNSSLLSLLSMAFRDRRGGARRCE